MVEFRKFKEDDIKSVAKIKESVFKKFNKDEYFKKDAVLKYLERTNPKKPKKELLEVFRISKDSIFFVAENKGKIIGYISGRKNKIGNLFVLGNFHKKGIGKELICLFEKEAKKQNSKFIKINSSIYAVSFYQKMGYKKTTGVRNFHGLKSQPMKKLL